MSGNDDVNKEESGVSAGRRTFMGAVGALAGASALGGSALADDHSDSTVGGDEGGSRSGGKAQNAILVIPDGAGQSHISGARYLKAYNEDSEAFPLNITPDETTLNVDRASAIGSMSTHPDDPTAIITDSAAAGTAMSTGSKSYVGAIGGVGSMQDFTPIKTILEAAHEAGMATGLVTTTRITHATPATFATHVPDRAMEDEIARQYVDNANVDVLMGAGMQHFHPEEREDGEDMLARAEEQGYQVVETDSELADVEEGKVLGLFGSENERASHMSYYVDREFVDDTDEPGLVEMTEKTIDLLSGHENGFFLMVESGRVDHASHASDGAVTYEQHECDEVFGTVLDYVEDDSTPETFTMQVADHETGGMSLGRGSSDMDWEAISSLHASIEHINWAADGAWAEERSNVDYYAAARELTKEHLGFDISEGEIIETSSGNLAEVLNTRTQIGWASPGHTGEEVPSYAHGPGCEWFGRYWDNTETSVGLANILGLDFEPGKEIDYDYRYDFDTAYE